MVCISTALVCISLPNVHIISIIILTHIVANGAFPSWLYHKLSLAATHIWIHDCCCHLHSLNVRTLMCSVHITYRLWFLFVVYQELLSVFFFQYQFLYIFVSYVPNWYFAGKCRPSLASIHRTTTTTLLSGRRSMYVCRYLDRIHVWIVSDNYLSYSISEYLSCLL